VHWRLRKCFVRIYEIIGRRWGQLCGRELSYDLDIKVDNPVWLGWGECEWCVSANYLNKSSIVYSIGVGRDISFDRDIIKEYGAEVYAFDPTPIAIQWLKTQSLPNQFHFVPKGLASYDGEAFFALPKNHNTSLSIIASGSVTDQDQVFKGEVCKLQTLMRILGHTHIDVLKIDIEGAEYDVINDIVDNAGNITQLLIEFHHRMKIGYDLHHTSDAIERLRSAGFRIFSVSPRGFEYSFIRTDE